MQTSKCCKATIKTQIIQGYPGKGFKTSKYLRCSNCNYIIDVLDLKKDIHNAHYSSKFNNYEQYAH